MARTMARIPPPVQNLFYALSCKRAAPVRARQKFRCCYTIHCRDLHVRQRIAGQIPVPKKRKLAHLVCMQTFASPLFQRLGGALPCQLWESLRTRRDMTA
jgi:hypothetical protein